MNLPIIGESPHKIPVIWKSLPCSDFAWSHLTFPSSERATTALHSLYYLAIHLITMIKSLEFPFCITVRNVGAYHYNAVIMNTMTSETTSVSIIYSTINSGADQRKHQSSASLAFVRGIHRSPVNSPHKGPVTRKMFPSDNVIMLL